MNYSLYIYMLVFVILMVIVDTVKNVYNGLPILTTMLLYIVSSFIGVLLFVRLDKLVKRKQTKSLKGVDSGQLHSKLKDHIFYYPEGCPPRLMLLELQDRGEDVSGHLENMIDLMVDNDRYFQRLALEAVSIYPEAIKILVDCKYNHEGPETERREVLLKVKEKLKKK